MIEKHEEWRIEDRRRGAPQVWDLQSCSITLVKEWSYEVRRELSLVKRNGWYRSWGKMHVIKGGVWKWEWSMCTRISTNHDEELNFVPHVGQKSIFFYFLIREMFLCVNLRIRDEWGILFNLKGDMFF